MINTNTSHNECDPHPQLPRTTPTPQPPLLTPNSSPPTPHPQLLNPHSSPSTHHPNSPPPTRQPPLLTPNSSAPTLIAPSHHPARPGQPSTRPPTCSRPKTLSANGSATNSWTPKPRAQPLIQLHHRRHARHPLHSQNGPARRAQPTDGTRKSRENSQTLRRAGAPCALR